MIDEAFEFLESYLNGTVHFNGVTIESSYLPQKGEVPPDGTISLYITLLNIEEERSNKNPNRYERSSGPKGIKEFNPEIVLNLYIMFSGYCSDYSESLKIISKVITVFADKSAFLKDEIQTRIPESKLEKLILDLHNISLDQNNSLWQAMATNVLPHVIYKVRAISIVPTAEVGEKTEVTEININAENL
jgi:hypothetical protein